MQRGALGSCFVAATVWSATLAAPSAASVIRFLFGLCATLFVARRSLRDRDTRDHDVAVGWALSAGSVALVFLRDVLRLHIGMTSPSHPIVGLVSFAGGACAIAAVFRLSATTKQHHQRTREAMEASLIGGSFTIVTWVAYLGPKYQHSDLPIPDRIMAIATPFGLASVAALTAISLLRTAPGGRRGLAMFFVGTTLMTAAETGLSAQVLDDRDPARQLAWAILSALAFTSYVIGSRLPASKTQARVNGGVMGVRLGWIVWIVPSSAALASAIPHLLPGSPDPELLAIATVVIAVHLVHQMLMVFENQRLVDVLDTRVAERTAELAAREDYYRGLFENSADVIGVVGPDHCFVDHTPSLKSVFGWDPKDLHRTRVDELFIGLGASEALAAYQRVHAEPGRIETINDRILHADGTWRTVEMHLANHLHNPAIRGVVATTRDVTVRSKLERDLEHQAFHDALTGLPNRAMFRNAVERSLSIAHQRRHVITVLFLDLDGFKNVNDSFGHPAGDALLQAFARRVKRIVRPEDTFARLGGDEFAVLLEPGANEDDTVRAIYDQLAMPFAVLGTEVHVSASIGLADNTTASSVDDLLRNSDVAMYRSKQARARAAVRFEPEMHEAAAHRLQMLADLRRAVENNEFSIWLQPVVEIATGAVTGFEALARWEHPTVGFVSPSEFIPLAEESGMIEAIGELVLRGAARAIAEENLRHGTSFSVNVNISARQLENPEFTNLVEQVLLASGLRSELLVLEITESMVMADPVAARGYLERLASLGVRIALDDFGTGYSSLAALSRFPLDVLKVDRAFVMGLREDSRASSALLSAIEEIGRALGLKLVAEGVETLDERDLLRDLGFGYAQGYLFGRPMPVAEALAAARADTASSAGTLR